MPFDVAAASPELGGGIPLECGSALLHHLHVARRAVHLVVHDDVLQHDSDERRLREHAPVARRR